MMPRPLLGQCFGRLAEQRHRRSRVPIRERRQRPVEDHHWVRIRHPVPLPPGHSTVPALPRQGGPFVGDQLRTTGRGSRCGRINELGRLPESPP